MPVLVRDAVVAVHVYMCVVLCVYLRWGPVVLMLSPLCSSVLFVFRFLGSDPPVSWFYLLSVHLFVQQHALTSSTDVLSRPLSVRPVLMGRMKGFGEY